jgi:hypothetical protein
MLKRLLIAVFVLGLVLALNGTAISDVSRGELNPVIKINPANQRYTDLTDARPNQPTFKKPESALQSVPPGQTLPSPPQSYFCDVQDYTSGSIAYGWRLPDAYGDDLFNMRFTSDAGYDCTLKVAYYLMYGGAYGSGANAMTGDPDFRAYLWDDDGFGFPGNKLDSVDIPWATIQAEWTAQGNVFWLTADFSSANWVFSDGEEYHYGWTTLQNSVDDTLSILSDAAGGPYAGEERSSENWNGTWGTMLNDWGIDISFFILSERCCAEQPFSDCYYQTYWQNIAYYWRAPHPVWGDEQYAMRMSVAGPETLMTVEFFVYDPGDGTFGNDTVYMRVWGDDGNGLPDPNNLIAEVALAPGTYSAFPAWTVADFTSFNLVMYDDFHVAFGSSGQAGVDYESCLSSDGTDGVGRSSSDWGGGYWVDMLSGWGIDVNFVFDAYMCRDEYSQCSWNWCYNGIAYFWRLPDAWGDVAQAQKFTSSGFEECRVQDVSWYLYDNGTPTAYTTQSKVSVYSDAGGLPGTELASILIGPGTPYPYTLFPAPMTVDFEPLNVTVSGDYWVAIESFGTDSTDGIRTLSDAGGGGCVDGWAEYWGIWALMWQDWGLPTQDWAALVDVFQCCIPYSGRDCSAAGEDWATYQHDYARTGASFNSLGDAWCDLTVNWHYEDPTQGVSFAGPIIAFDKVISSFTDHYVVFDLDGTQLYTLSGGYLGGSIRSTPTAAVVGTDTLLFVSGGSQQSVQAYNLNTGALVWSRDLSTYPAELYGLTRWGRFAIVNLSGTDYLFWTTDDGFVVAADAATGVKHPSYPVALPQPIYVSNATDGVNIYVATYSTASDGDVYSIDAATGAINWTAATANGGLCGVSLWPTPLTEGFTAGVSYDATTNAVFANSRAVGVSSGNDYPADGVMYSIDATSGLINWCSESNRGFYATPIIDANNIFMPCLTIWVSPATGGDLLSFNKNSGALVNAYSPPPGAQGETRYYVDGLLTCEPEDGPYPEDLLYVFSGDGYLSCVQSVSFNEIYRRRIDHMIPAYGPDLGMAGAVAPDEFGNVHLVFGTYWGDIIDMTKQVDRPRLEIQTYNPTAAIDFGSATSYPVTIPGVFTNTGCVDLNIENVQVDEISWGQNIPEFSAEDFGDTEWMNRAEKIADKLARDVYIAKFARIDDMNADNILSVREIAQSKETMNRAAAGFPPYLNAVVHPAPGDVIAPGDTMDLELDVIQSNINRGPQCFYILIDSDDPDFFLNDTTRGVEIRVCLIGGCLIDLDTLYFGVGQANVQLVTNTGRIGTGDWDPHAFNIDGDDATYYQGAYVYAVDTFRIATNTQDWVSGGGEADAFVSLQADPNWCDNDCHPALSAGVSLGEWTTDGLTYETIIGNMICKSFLDSVQNFDLGFGWDWENFGAPFDNALTMGLYVNSRVVGAYELSPSGDPIPELSNLTLEILEFSERNGDSVPGWYFGELWDHDVLTNGGSFDTSDIDRSISTAWAYNYPNNDVVWGQIKIPFGCGYEPLLNNWGEYGASGTPGHGFWGWGIFWDSCYAFMSRGTGYFSDGPISSGDGEGLVTFASKDFGPNDTLSIGIAHFAVHGLQDASSSAEFAWLPKLVNKWAGFGRGDVNNDDVINLADIIWLAGTVNGGPGAIPFRHLADVNADGNIDMADVDYLIDYYFNCGPCPIGDWIF